MPHLSADLVKQEASRRTDKVRSLADGQGLALVIPRAEQGGNARWVLRFSWQGKESMRGLGDYPDVSLLEARRAATTSRAQIQKEGPPVSKLQPSAAAVAAQLTGAGVGRVPWRGTLQPGRR